MFDSAARCGELLNMTFGDFNVAGKYVQVMGKGDKPRLIPVTDNTVEHFKRYAKVFHPNSIVETPLFYTIHRHKSQPMSHDNVARFLNVYASSAHNICPEIPQKVKSHQLRHSRAMGLYRKGMPLSLLSEWLGHEDPETTLIYAYADIEMKRKAIEKASSNNRVTNPLPVERIWEGNEDMIHKLCGLS
jgi:site-specific recombinase XerD